MDTQTGVGEGPTQGGLLYAERQQAAWVVRRGSWIEAFGGLAVVGLSVLGLLGILPATLLGIAALALGAAYLIESGSFAVEFPKLFTREDEPTEVAEVGSGVGGEFAAGLAGIVLGVLALAGVMPGLLLPVTAIVYGAGLVLASLGPMRVRHLGVQGAVGGPAGHYPRGEAVTFAAWLTALCGLGAIVLGVVTLVMVPGPAALSLTLPLLAFVALGFATWLSGSVVARQMVHLYRPAAAH